MIVNARQTKPTVTSATAGKNFPGLRDVHHPLSRHLWGKQIKLTFMALLHVQEVWSEASAPQR